MQGEYRPSRCLESPVVTHVKPFGYEARRLQAARRSQACASGPLSLQPKPCPLPI